MAAFYGLKIIAGEMSVEDVPKLWKTMTEKWLKENSSLEETSGAT